jgi:hypothetical protein
VDLQFLENLGRLLVGDFETVSKQVVGLLEQVISPFQGLYLHRTTQHRKKKDDSSIQAVKTYALDRAATVIGIFDITA